MYLSLLVAIPLFGAVLLALAGRVGGFAARVTALATCLLDLIVAILLASATAQGQVTYSYPWSPAFGASFALQADGFSATMALLTAFVGVVCVLISWKSVTERVASYFVWLLLLQTGSLLVFLSSDMLLFYFGYELTLIPIFFLIGGWGQETRLRASLKFFLFTFGGSIFLLASLLYLYFLHAQQHGFFSFAYGDLLTVQLSAVEQWWVFLGMFLGFAVKAPLFPFHVWLPDAHTHAPANGAVDIMGLLLKTGVYGLMRIAMPLSQNGWTNFSGLIIALAVISIFYGAFAAFSQFDFRRLVAYSSISHAGFLVLGIFVGNTAGYSGTALQMVNLALATGALFIIAGCIQARSHTRDLEMMGGLWRQAPAMGGFLLFFSLASLGLPGTGNFVGELYIIAGAFVNNFTLGSLVACSVLLAAAYSLKLYISVMQGPESRVIRQLSDLTPMEGAALGMMATALILVGLRPDIVTVPFSRFPSNVQLAANIDPILRNAVIPMQPTMGRRRITNPPPPAPAAAPAMGRTANATAASSGATSATVSAPKPASAKPEVAPR